MKRLLREFALVLILGSVVSIVVAWSCALWSKRTGVLTEPQFAPKIVLNKRFAIEEIENATYLGKQEQSFGNLYVFSTMRQAKVDMYEYRHTTVNMFRQGWPMLCLTGEYRFGYQAKRSSSYALVATPHWLLESHRMIALGPMPLGMLVDSAFFGTPLWLLSFGIERLKTTIRKRNKRCINCGYDLRGTKHDACPECGVQL